MSKNSNASIYRYEAKAYDKTLLRLYKGELDKVRAHAAARGESLNGFVNRAIRETMQRDALDRPTPADDLPK